MCSGDQCRAWIWCWQKANRARLCTRIGFVHLPHVAALICFLKTAKIRTRLISRLRRSTIQHPLSRRKRSSSKINCRGLRSTNRFRRFRQSQRRSLTTDRSDGLRRRSLRRRRLRRTFLPTLPAQRCENSFRKSAAAGVAHVRAQDDTLSVSRMAQVRSRSSSRRGDRSPDLNSRQFVPIRD